MNLKNLETYLENIVEFVMDQDSGSRQDIHEDVSWVHDDLSEDEQEEHIDKCEDMFSDNDHNIEELIKFFLTGNEPNYIKTYEHDCIGSDLYDNRFTGYSEHSWIGIFSIRDMFSSPSEFIETFEIKEEDQDFITKRLELLDKEENYINIDQVISVYKV